MLDSRHRKTRSTQRDIASPVNNNVSAATQASVLPSNGAIEWSKTNFRACSRLVPSLDAIFNRGDNFNGVAGDSYGLLLSNDSAFIFPYTTTSANPPILTFPLPQGEDRLLGALVPGPTSEPGLMVVMPTTGRIGFWPALHSALAPSAGIESQLTLSSGEQITHVCNAGAAGVVLSSSSGRLVHVSLRDAAGKPVVLLTNMSGSAGWLGALRNITSRKDVVSIKAGAAQSREQRQIHVITRTGGLTVWDVARGGDHRSVVDVDLSTHLQERGVASILDVTAYPALTNAVLVLGQTSQGLTKLVGLKLDLQGRHDFFHDITLPALDHAQLQLPNPGHVAFVHTRKSVYIVSLEDKYVESINLKEHVDVVAIGIEDQLKTKRNPGLILLTNGAGVLRIEIFQSAPNKRPHHIKSRIEQAIFYGDKDANPICFTPAPSDADVQTREVSAEILGGLSAYSPSFVNLGDVLRHRLLALQNLAHYISHGVKPTTLQVMREHAEKMAAGQALWNSVDARVETSSIISQLLPVPPKGTTSNSDLDSVRLVFLHGLQQIQEMIPKAHRACVEAAAVLDGQALAAVVTESNEIILSILITATKYRDEHPEYGSKGEKWSSAKDILRSTTIQFDITKRLVAGLRTGEGDDLRDQLVGLASTNCRLYKDFLDVTLPDSSEGKLQSLTYLKLRPMWLKTLVECGRSENAFDIGERFHDYSSLIEICHEEGKKANDEDTIGNVVRRLEWYLHSFGYDFAAVLWEYYIANRQFWNLLHEFPNYRHFLTRFFSNGRYPNISWMNDVINKDFDNAGLTLLEMPESSMDKRKIQLSIAKLALLVNNDPVSHQVEQAEKEIRFNATIGGLLFEIREVSKDAIDTIAATDLASAALMCAHYTIPDRGTLLRRHITKLVAGETLTLGEAIDYMTSKLRPNFFGALQLLECSSSLDAVKDFYEALIWRRCFVSDDWLKVNDTRGRSSYAVEQTATQTNLYLTIKQCISDQTTFRTPAPAEVHFKKSLVTSIDGLSHNEFANLELEYAMENVALNKYIGTANLANWHTKLLQSARESLMSGSDDDRIQTRQSEVNRVERDTIMSE